MPDTGASLSSCFCSGPQCPDCEMNQMTPRVLLVPATSKPVAVITTLNCSIDGQWAAVCLGASPHCLVWRGGGDTGARAGKAALTLWWGPGPATAGCLDPSTRGPAGTARPAGPLRSCWSRCLPSRGSCPSSRQPCLPGSQGQTQSRAPRSSRS